MKHRLRFISSALWLILVLAPVPWVAPGIALAAGSDFNGDGKADVLWRNRTTGDLAVWQMDGLTFVGADVATLSHDWAVYDVGDLNGDGKADLVWRDIFTGDVAVWLMDGFTIVGAAVIANVPLASRWDIRHVGDLNGDGKADLVWRNFDTGDVAVWQMDGLTFDAAFIANASRALFIEFIEQVGDLNGDGKADLVWHNRTTGDVAVWLMDGATIVGTAVLATVSREWIFLLPAEIT